MIHDEYNADVLEAVLAMQKSHWERGRGQTITCVCDDTAYNAQSFNCKQLRALFLNGRHNKVGAMMTTQYSVAIPPILRGNADFVIIMRDSLKSNRKRYYQQFFSHFDTFKQFNAVFESCTTGNECIVLNNVCTSNDVSDQIFWWKARNDLPPFKIGNKMWELHEKYKENHDNRGRDADHII
jgi:hypothetical protein